MYGLKASVKSFIGAVFVFAPCWLLLKYTLVPFVQYGVRVRDRKIAARLAVEWVKKYVPNLTVARGPFRGLRYAECASAGSTLPPKLLGTYESELQPLVAGLLDGRYRVMVDIGAAEGYYAVGFALKNPEIRVFAFDLSAEARRLCLENARENGVVDRLVVAGECTQPMLRSCLPTTGRALIISDCEGYERVLFDGAMAQDLAKHDILIEVHHAAVPGVGEHLKELFSSTHNLLEISGLFDEQRPWHNEVDELKGLAPKERIPILAEHRRGQGSWYFFSSK